ncbi:MAG: ROK family protein, partial [Bryobacteraceae bacterium]|nr:ROK family protein [Bryobacteraceae bacterium]
TEASLGPERALGQICAVMDDGLIGVGRRLEAIGVGCTGPVDPVAGVIGDVALLPGWQGYPLRSHLEQHFKAPACLENDCDAAALGEFSYGAGRGSDRFLYTTISTGIGVGIVVDGKVYRGTAGAHPELGHHTIDHSAGPDCYCGSRGCWESLASGPAIAEWFNIQSADSPDATAADVFLKASAGNELARRAVERFTQYLAIGLGNLITFFAPDTIVLGGGVMASAPAFLERAAGLARSRAGLVPSQSVAIRLGVLGRQAGLVGAASAAQLLNPPLEEKS